MTLTCIYCGRPFDPSSTSPAHVIPRGLGGRYAPCTTECNECNPALNAAFEGGFVVAFQKVASQLGCRWAPAILVRDPEQPNMRLHGGVFVPSGRGPVQTLPDGRKEVRFYGTIEQQADALFHHLRRTGTDTLEKFDRDDWKAGFELEFRPRQVGDVPESVTPLSEDAVHRTVGKIPLGLIGGCNGPAARRPELDSLRMWIRYGGRVPAGVEFRITQPLAGQEFHHEVDSASFGRCLLGRVRLFGHVDISIKLTDAWSGGPLHASHEIDPLAGRTIRRAMCVESEEDEPTWWRGGLPLSARSFSESVLVLNQAVEGHLRKTLPDRMAARPPAEEIDVDELLALVRQKFDDAGE